jgi:hypothetical protein
VHSCSSGDVYSSGGAVRLQTLRETTFLSCVFDANQGSQGAGVFASDIGLAQDLSNPAMLGVGLVQFRDCEWRNSRGYQGAAGLCCVVLRIFADPS